MTTQLELWKRRIEKQTAPKINKKEIRQKILHFRKVAHLFNACGKLSELQAEMLEKQLK